MNAATIAIIIFIVLELTNIIMLYFFPATGKGNGIGVFNAYEKSKSDPEIHSFIRYMVAWVAGTKLIFVALLIVIILTGSRTTKLLSVAVLIPSIATFYWRLYPAIRRMDRQGELNPKGYSKILFWMIAVLILSFLTALAVSLFMR